MERVLESQKIESMRKMIMMQEQVFKQQLHELHRLYDLQKKLMQETRNGLKHFKARNDQNEASGSNSAEISRLPSSSIHHFEEQKNVDDEGGDVEVELTLSLGHCTRKQRSQDSSSTKMDNITHSNTYQDQENTRPHWLLQDLSLHRT